MIIITVIKDKILITIWMSVYVLYINYVSLIFKNCTFLESESTDDG